MCRPDERLLLHLYQCRFACTAGAIVFSVSPETEHPAPIIASRVCVARAQPIPVPKLSAASPQPHLQLPELAVGPVQPQPSDKTAYPAKQAQSSEENVNPAQPKPSENPELPGNSESSLSPVPLQPPELEPVGPTLPEPEISELGPTLPEPEHNDHSYQSHHSVHCADE